MWQRVCIRLAGDAGHYFAGTSSRTSGGIGEARRVRSKQSSSRACCPRLKAGSLPSFDPSIRSRFKIEMKSPAFRRGKLFSSSSSLIRRILCGDRHWDPLVNGYELALAVPRVDLARTGDFLFGVGDQFLPLCQPARRSGNGEEHREHLGAETHRLVHDAGIEIDIGIEFALYEIVVFQSNAFQLKCDV